MKNYEAQSSTITLFIPALLIKILQQMRTILIQINPTYVVIIC